MKEKTVTQKTIQPQTDMVPLRIPALRETTARHQLQRHELLQFTHSVSEIELLLKRKEAVRSSGHLNKLH